MKIYNIWCITTSSHPHGLHLNTGQGRSCHGRLRRRWATADFGRRGPQQGPQRLHRMDPIFFAPPDGPMDPRHLRHEAEPSWVISASKTFFGVIQLVFGWFFLGVHNFLRFLETFLVQCKGIRDIWDNTFDAAWAGGKLVQLRTVSKSISEKSRVIKKDSWKTSPTESRSSDHQPMDSWKT